VGQLVCRYASENTTEDTRAEGLIRDLEHAMDTDTHVAAAPSGSIFGAFFAKKPAAPAAAAVDLMKYLIRPAVGLYTQVECS
jgi:hypothetical protein